MQVGGYLSVTIARKTVAELDTNTLIGYLGAGVGALITLGVTLREYFKREKIDGAFNDSQLKGIRGNDKVLDNLVDEVARLSARISELENKVENLTEKLATVRLIALDCYQIANECDCAGDNRALLLNHLKQIIKDA